LHDTDATNSRSVCWGWEQTRSSVASAERRPMKDPSKTNDQLMNELAEMRRQIAELKKSQTEHKRADEARELSHRFLNIVNRRTGATCLLTEIVGEIGKFTGCAAVGIRLLDEEGNIPYEAYTGFSRSFYESESPLSVESDRCMCINVVKGDTDPTLPFFTKGGSFYTNGTTRFLATCPEEEKGETRNKCNQEGYESVALVPIRTRDGISGLIHVADTRENMVPLEMVEVLEIVAQQLATAIERALAEEALRESEERFRAIFEQAADAIVLLDGETGAMVEFNDRAYENLGYTREEFETISLADIEAVESPQDVAEHVKRIVDEDADTFETKHRRKDGELRDIIVNTRTISAHGREFITAIWHDTTELKQAEEALRENERRLRLIADTIEDVFWITDWVEHRTIYANPAYERIWGRCVEELYAHPSHWADAIHPDDRQRAWDAFVEMEDGDRYDKEYRVIRPDGSMRWIRDRGFPIRDDTGQVYRVVGIAQDITERKQTEDALKEAEERHRAVFEQAADSIMLFDPETGAMVEFNDRACENLGYTREEFETISLADIDVAESPQETAKHIERLVKEGGAAFETRHRTKNGELRNVLVRSKVVSVQGKKLIVSILHDITEQKRAEEELRKHRFHLEDLVAERTAELTRSQQQLRSLAAYIQATREEERASLAREIHDEFGQMLTSLTMDLSSVEQLISEVDDDDLRHLLLEKVQSMSGLSDETMRTVRRISAALRPSVLDHFGVVAAIEWFAQDFQERTGIVCTVTSTEKTLEVGKGTSTALFRICQEALTNVARHADATRVAISIKNKDKIHTLTVKDNGRGITETETHNQESFGILGMQERALSIGGDFRISGHPNNGTEVTVRFRAADRKESEEPVRAFDSSVAEYVPHAGLEPENDG